MSNTKVCLQPVIEISRNEKKSALFTSFACSSPRLISPSQFFFVSTHCAFCRSLETEG